MKKIILNFDENIDQQKFKELFQAALNYGLFDIYLDDLYFKKIKDIDRLQIYSKSLNHNPDNLILVNPSKEELSEILKKPFANKISIGCSFNLSTKDDEKKILTLAKNFPDLSFLLIKATDWKVIPFENLIAQLGKVDISLYAEVDTVEDAILLLNTLEIGVDGVLFSPSDASSILDLKNQIGKNAKIQLSNARIIGIKEISQADRVCVDTTSMLNPGEGMLVGSTSKGFALVHAEVFETEFVNSRPFRVNAGDVSAYTLVPSMNELGNLEIKTNYLSELKAGDDIFITDVNGNLRIVSVGRVKIETRPMLLFQLLIEIPEIKNTKKQSIPMNIILQNAETIRLVKDNFTPTSVVDFKIGDYIIAFVGPGSTHFGTSIKETIIEK